MSNFTARDAYNIIHDREYKFATFNGLTEEQANRHAAKMAVKYTWKQFHSLKKMKENIKNLNF